MGVKQTVKDKPMMATLLTIATIAGGGTAIWAGVGLVDQLHTTESELLLYDLKAHTFASEQFTTLKLEIEAADVLSKCRDLRSQIRALTDAIYVRTRDDADADYIHELENDLAELEQDYTVLSCARLLA